MSKYLLQQKSFNKLKNIDLKDGFTFSSSKISNIVIYDNKIAREIVVKKFSNKYLKICQLLKMVDEDDAESGYQLIFEDINRLIELLLNSYNKFLSKELYAKFLNDILYIKGITVSKYKQVKEYKNECKRR